MRAISLGALVALSLAACTPAQNPPDPKLIARGTVETLETAWTATAQACINVSTAQQDPTIKAQCAQVLTPARDALIAAGYAVDGWTSSDQQDFPCLIANVLAALQNVGALVTHAGVTLPPVVNDALAMAGQFAGACVDAGPAPVADGGAE